VIVNEQQYITPWSIIPVPPSVKPSEHNFNQLIFSPLMLSGRKMTGAMSTYKQRQGKHRLLAQEGRSLRKSLGISLIR
jgi:alanine-alpha-ketoisovalerate/valine-pyruvate aminotransferase